MNIEKKEIIHNLNDFGKITIKESPKSIEKKQKEEFLTMVGDLEISLDNSERLMELGIDPIMYEDTFYKIIENLMSQTYGPGNTLVIFWWLKSRIEEPGKKYKLKDYETEKVYNVTTPTQLWNYVKKNRPNA